MNEWLNGIVFILIHGNWNGILNNMKWQYAHNNDRITIWLAPHIFETERKTKNGIVCYLKFEENDEKGIGDGKEQQIIEKWGGIWSIV